MWPHISSDEAHRIAFGFSPPDDRYFATRLRDGLGEWGRTPLRSRTERQQRAWQTADQVGFGTCRGERKTNAAGGLDDTGGDFQETKTQRCELGSGQFPDFGNGVAHGQHQPISGGVENEADLIGERRTVIGLTKSYIGRGEETEAHINEALRLSPRDTLTYRWLLFRAVAKLQLGADTEAVAWLRRSIEANRSYPLAHFLLAAALALIGQLDQARAAAQAGLTLDPTFTIRRFRFNSPSDNPTFLLKRQRLYEGMRAGMPEG